jgi:tagatose-1,6-bisphosphate aldolase
VTEANAGAASGHEGSTEAGRRRRIGRLGGANGIIAGIALDHRDSLRVVLERQGIVGLSTAGLRDLKAALARELAPAATAVMLDAELGSLALEAGDIPPAIGLIMPLEAQGYEAQGDRRLTSLLEDFSPLEALRLGADACKLLLPYRVDDEPAAALQDAVLVESVAACHALGLPLVVEPVVHRLSAESPEAYARAYTRLVVDAVARLQPLGADLLKLPFPIPHLEASTLADARDACRVLASACGTTAWVVLGGGADIDILVDEIRLAGEAGAVGFLAGRSVWGPVLRADVGETARLAAEIARPAFERCRAMAERTARPLATGRG